MTDAARLPAHLALREATADCHARVDAAFGRFDLADPAAYTSFLLAHARVLPAVEAALADGPCVHPFAPRGPLIASDLAGLGVATPGPISIDPPGSAAAAWGMTYVIEGSRLGGVMLARAVPDGLPKAYLSAAHERGGWRILLQTMDEAAGDDADWRSHAVDAARMVFGLYATAAGPNIGEGAIHKA